MLYAIYSKRDQRSPYAIQENQMSSKITLLTINVENKEQILPALNIVYNRLASSQFEPELEEKQRYEKLKKLAEVIRRVRLAKGSSDRKIWYNSVGALVKGGFPPEKLEEIIWA